MMTYIYTNRKHFTFFLALLLILNCILTFSVAHAADSEDVDRVYDYASSLNDSEENDLETLAEEYYQKTGNNYLIVTTTTLSEYEYKQSSSSERNCELYSESFYNSFVSTYGKSYKNCAILTVDLSKNRYADISGQNELKTKLDNERCTLAFEKIKSNLSDGDYYDACEKYMKTVNRYQQITPGINPDSIFLKIWFQFLLALVIGGVIIAIMIYQSGGKMTVSSQTYLDSQRSKTVNKHDRYTHTRTTRTKRSNNSNKSGGGSSSSGGSHGGGHF